MKQIEIFLQGEGIKEVVIVKVPAGGRVKDILDAAQAEGHVHATGAELLAVFLEDQGLELSLDSSLADAGIDHKTVVHVHRCKEVKVTVHFNGRDIHDTFPPSTRVKRIHKWATGENGFGMTSLDASEHALQICGTSVRPDEDVHIGTLLSEAECSIGFDLVPKKRVEG